ncbi:Dyp-type peroxidase family protein [Variovorax sp. SRS16]|uniref:Dyp-type peroxidase n=1 Tax=Variovorax sp. SRS16 TaxID=282217 RepID=UPI001315B85F|nr:peroxidase [Variovorax sp. SRS16]VTU20931.1 Dyp-type peroxidase family protein [Variovorax sp. SRS16]
MSASTMRSVEYEDIQGLMRFGYGKLTEACFLLLRIKDPAAARAWLAGAPVANAAACERAPETAMQIAFTSEGLRALGVAEDIVQGFSPEFIAGMNGDPSRARRLGDLGPNAPAEWAWGGAPQRLPHVLVMLYAMPHRLQPWQDDVCAALAAGFDRIGCLATSDMKGFEPFGFADGISEPMLDWKRTREARDQELPTYTNLSCLGEFLLGYPNEYGEYTDRPLLDAERDPQAMLARAEDDAGKADLGRNGSYLIVRTLRQDVGRFWRFLDAQAGGDAARRVQLAQAMVGRTMDGAPLVDFADKRIDGEDELRNTFTYDKDPSGLRCPFGAHIRRSNPRNADLPPGDEGFISWARRTLGFDADALARDLIASTRFHRVLRRGREYGKAMSMSEALGGAAEGEDTGLHFICLGANIARQFEFVQGAWLAGIRFDGARDESDPLIATHLPRPDGTRTDAFSMPMASGPDERIAGLPQFVTVRGGAYFFLPGLRALRYLSKVQP